MTARRRPETYKNKKPQITQITQIFFRVPLCNFVANFLVIFMAGEIFFSLCSIKSSFLQHIDAKWGVLFFDILVMVDFGIDKEKKKDRPGKQELVGIGCQFLM